MAYEIDVGAGSKANKIGQIPRSPTQLLQHLFHVRDELRVKVLKPFRVVSRQSFDIDRVGRLSVGAGYMRIANRQKGAITLDIITGECV
jgi:hypothetical protein